VQLDRTRTRTERRKPMFLAFCALWFVAMVVLIHYVVVPSINAKRDRF
jgi:hypothetical protein